MKIFFMILVVVMMLASVATTAEQGIADEKSNFFVNARTGQLHGEVFVKFFYELLAYIEVRVFGNNEGNPDFKTDPSIAYKVRELETHWRTVGNWQLRRDIRYEIFLRYQLPGEWKYRSLKIGEAVWQPDKVVKK